MPADARPILTLAELEASDPHAPAHGNTRRFLCPLPACAGKPRDDGHRSIALATDTGLWTCYRCAAGGRLREQWQPKRTEQRARLRRAFGAAPAPRPAVRTETAEKPPAAARTPATPERPAFDWRGAYEQAHALPGTPGGRYLEGRSIPRDLAVAAGARFCPGWYGRPAVLFPVSDRTGTLTAVHGRYTDGRDNPKSRTGGALKLGLFASPGALAARPIIITEAPIDALSLAAAGAPAVGLCGKSWPAWLPEACAFRPVLCNLDGDAAGDEASAKLATALRYYGAAVERLKPTAGKDANELLQRYGMAGLRAGLLGDGPVLGSCVRCGAFCWRPPGAPASGWWCVACGGALLGGGAGAGVCNDCGTVPEDAGPSPAEGTAAMERRLARGPLAHQDAAPVVLSGSPLPAAAAADKPVGDCPGCGQRYQWLRGGRCSACAPERWRDSAPDTSG